MHYCIPQAVGSLRVGVHLLPNRFDNSRTSHHRIPLISFSGALSGEEFIDRDSNGVPLSGECLRGLGCSRCFGERRRLFEFLAKTITPETELNGSMDGWMWDLASDLTAQQPRTNKDLSRTHVSNWLIGICNLNPTSPPGLPAPSR